MNCRLALIVFALIPLLLLQSCSTRPTVKESAGTRQASGLQDASPAEKASSLPHHPRYGRVPGGTDEVDAMFGTFPRPKSLEAQIKFWRDVYSTWSRSQVAIHDNLYLNVVYEVLQLPGSVMEGMTGSQKEYVRERMDYWRDRLGHLQAKTAARLPLGSDEQRLANLLAQSDDGEAAIEGAGERLRYQRGMRERFRRGLELSGMYERRFRDIFRRAGLPEDLVYLPHVESSYQANARSSAGALGIWQFTPGAARMFMNGDDSVRARLDPIASAYGAARYLSYAYGKLGSWPLAVTSYNHGIGGMQRAKSLYGHNFDRIVKDYDHPLFGFASRNYYAEFLAAREIASEPEQFFPEGVMYAQDSDWSLSRLAADEGEVRVAPRTLALETAKPLLPVARAKYVAPVRQPAARSHRPTVRQVAVAKGKRVVLREAGKPKLAKAEAKPLKAVSATRVPARAAPTSPPPRKLAVARRPAAVAASPATRSRQAAAPVRSGSAKIQGSQKMKVARR